MRITMICLGSTGDVKPYIILGRELRRRGHEITITAFSDFQQAVEKEDMGFRPISGDVREFMANIMKPGVNGITYLKQIRDTMKPIVQPFLDSLVEACDGAECVIATFFGQIFRSVAEMKRLPFIQTQYFLMDKNSQAPVASAPGQRVGRMWNVASYQLAYFLISTLEKYYLDDWRKEHGLPPRRLERNASYEMNGHIIPVLYAISPLVVPRPASWGANIHMTGYWVDEHPVDFTPEEGLTAFLEAGEKPIYVGFGSMVSGDMGETLQIVLEAIRLSGVRAVIAKGWGNAEIPEMPNVYVSGFVPHEWLFPKVRGVVHHGGAGTLAAGILAGQPTLVIPFGGDQSFWGERVRQLGIGPNPIPRERLSATKLAKSIEQLVSEKRYQVAAKELGMRLKTEDGVVNAADVIEHELRKWLRLEGRPAILVRKDAPAHGQAHPAAETH